MKKFAFLLVVLLFVGMNSNAQTVIGKIENGKGKITIDESALKAKWENYLKTEGIRDANIGNFVILKSTEGIYFVVCSDFTQRGTLSNKYGIVLSVNGLMLASGESSCTCVGACGDGCSPEQSGSHWRCTDFWPTVATCTKSETAKTTSAF